MSKRVGIPRSLFYYQFFPLWKTFFEELGAEIVVSDRTTKKILDDGVKTCVDEACLPVKLFHGHVINLKGRVDYLYIPRFTSISKKEYICPKFGGLPDMIKHTIPGLPEVISTEVNMRKSGKGALKAALETGRYFCSDRSKIKRSFEKAINSYENYQRELQNGIMPEEILDSIDKKSSKKTEYVNTVTAGHDTGTKSSSIGAGENRISGKLTLVRNNTENKEEQQLPKLNIAVLGHGYNLYDGYINMNILDKLKKNGANIFTIDMMDDDIINEKSRLLNKRMFWNFGRKVMGTAFHLLDRDDIDGIIYLMSFECGIDSFVCDLAEKKIRQVKDIPFIILTIDEHSGEAGLNTRLEAFLDMIRWRNRNEAYIPSFG